MSQKQLSHPEENLDKSFRDVIWHGDCSLLLKKVPSQHIDLVLTSPPYANKRSKNYGGIEPDRYIEWFIPIAQELYRILQPTGSFVLNIKEPVIDGQRHTFVIELILELKKQGWRWVDEYCWHKKNSYPGKWNNRFRDSWERCLHFTKEKKFSMYQDSVMIPVGDWKRKRFKKLSENDKQRNKSSLDNGLSRNVSNWKDRDMVYPTNVLHLATECGNRRHCAAFPIELPTWFIKLFTKKGDLVLDPFLGSGTTALASKQLDRHFLGIELNKDYYELAARSLDLF